MSVFSWQRYKDSNLNIRSQSPLCYHYTIPLYEIASGIIQCSKEKVKPFSSEFLVTAYAAALYTRFEI